VEIKKPATEVAGLTRKHPICPCNQASDSPSFSDNPFWRIWQRMFFYGVPFRVSLLHPQKRRWKAMTWPEVKKIAFSSY